MEAVLIVSMMTAIITMIIAGSKGRNTIGWGILGFLFGLFAIVGVACVPKIEKAKEEKETK